MRAAKLRHDRRLPRLLAALPTTSASSKPRPDVQALSTRAARRLNRGCALLSASVLADSAVEHYRGSFHNKAMVAPLVTAALSLAVSAHGNADKRASTTAP